MPKFNYLKSTFSAGELTPKLGSRTDLQQYAQGSTTMRNCIPMLQGGFARRPGTQYVAATISNTARALYPFIFSQNEAYVVTVGTANMETTNVETHVENAVSRITGGVAGTDAFYWTDNLTDLYFTNDLQHAQSADVMWFVRPDFCPQKLSRTAVDTFELKRLDYHSSIAAEVANRFPFQDTNLTAITMTPSAVSGTGVTLTSSSAYFNANMVGAFFTLNHSGTRGACRVTAYTNSTHVTISVYSNFGATTAVTDWAESAWSNYRGWPRSIGFFEDRIVYGGNATFPDTIWFSESSNYDKMNDFAIGSSLTDSSPFNVTLGSSEVNQIQWLSSGSKLSVGTLGAEWVLYSGDPTTPIKWDTATAKSQTSYGSVRLQPKRNDSLVYFVTQGRREIRDIHFDLNEDSYVSDSMSVLADHLPIRTTGFGGETYITKMDFDKTRQTLWCLSNQGNLFGMTRDRQLNIVAFHSHVLGGSYVNGNPQIQSLCVVPSSDASKFSELWMCVVRTTNSGAKYTLEYMGRSYEQDVLHDDSNLSFFAANPSYAPVYVDLAKFDYSSPAKTSYTSFSHLIGQSVDILADGQSVGSQTVDVSGHITLSIAATEVIVGLPYTPLVKTMRLDAGSTLGSAQDAIRRIDRVGIEFYKTSACQVGPDEDTLIDLDFLFGASPGTQIPLFTGRYVEPIDFLGDYDREGYVVITSDVPLPLTVLSITMRGVLHEG
jgi:hypothetical protein